MAWRKTARCWYKRPAACRPSPAPTSACGRCASELPTPGPNTMLRLAVILLLLANAGYRAWSQSLLRPWGLAPEAQTEPQRMHLQIRPETLQILPPGPGTTAPTPTAPPVAASTASGQTPDPSAERLRAGVFDEQQAAALRPAAAGLPAGSWTLEPSLMPGRWMVYMGRFDDQDALDKKRTELRARKVDFDRAGGPWEPGLSLGRFSSEEAARRELQNLSSKGVRSARVIRERPESIGYTLRLPAVTDALRPHLPPLPRPPPAVPDARPPQLAALRSALAGKTWRNCD